MGLHKIIKIENTCEVAKLRKKVKKHLFEKHYLHSINGIYQIL